MSAVAIIALLASGLLTGCEDPGLYAPMAFSRDGDTLLVAVCNDISVKSVIVSERVQPEDWRDLLVASGTANLSTGDVLRVPGGYPGLDASKSGTSKFLRSASLAVSLDATDENESLLGSFHDLSLLKSGLWTNPKGKSSPSPCVG